MKIKAKYSVVAYQEKSRNTPTLTGVSKVFRNKQDALEYSAFIQESTEQVKNGMPEGKWVIVDLETILD